VQRINDRHRVDGGLDKVGVANASVQGVMGIQPGICW